MKGMRGFMKARDVFEILVREHSDMLWAYLRSTVFDSVAAEDLYQETLVVAWRRLDDYDKSRPFGAWVRGIAGKLVLAHIRKTGRRGMALCDGETLDALAEKFSQLEEPPATEWNDRLDALKQCMEKLPGEDQKIVARHYNGEEDCKVIAGSMGMNTETVKKRLQRARAALADCIERRMTSQSARATV